MPLSRVMRGAWFVVVFSTIGRAQQPECHLARNEGSACRAGGLTLAEAIHLAQKQGNSAEVSRQALDAARARDRAFNARLMPQVSLGGDAANYNHSIIPVVDPVTGQTHFIPQSENTSS